MIIHFIFLKKIDVFSYMRSEMNMKWNTKLTSTWYSTRGINLIDD
jgi:hypothetical protein